MTSLVHRNLLSLASRRLPVAFYKSARCYSRTPLVAKTFATTFNLPDPTTPTTPSADLQMTKIVATIGPTSEQEEPLKKVTAAGMRVMRLNFSHATKEEVELRCTNLVKAQEALTPGQDIRAILLDTKGPEIRSGKLANDDSGHETITLKAGGTITLHTDSVTRDNGSTEKDLYIDYSTLHKCMSPGMKVLLDDGAVVLTVQSIDGTKVVCKIENTGDIRSRAGVNLPLADTSDLPAMSEKDKADILYGMTKDIDFVAASFVQTAEGVREIRHHIRNCAKQLGWDPSQPLPLIISKIETAGSLKHFDEILEESDGIMVARGDLGVEIPLHQVINAQKEIVAACNAAGKPVVVATQMLESMTKSPRPTRAEVSDVTNAVYDGADAVMLSGETAKGKYPSETVKFMSEIILSAERYARSGALGQPEQKKFLATESSPDYAVARAAVAASHENPCAAILVLTLYGSLPRLVSAYRPNVPIFAFCHSSKMARQLQLHRGVHPIVHSLDGADQHARVTSAVEKVKEMGLLRSGDHVVIVSSEEDDTMGHTYSMKLAREP